MALKHLSDRPPPPLPGPECYEPLRGAIVLVKANGTTTGFPLTWLYQWHLKPASVSSDTLTLFLTDHQVTVEGQCLAPLGELLEQNAGFRLTERTERYRSLKEIKEIYISNIFIRPNQKHADPLNN